MATVGEEGGAGRCRAEPVAYELFDRTVFEGRVEVEGTYRAPHFPVARLHFLFPVAAGIEVGPEPMSQTRTVWFGAVGGVDFGGEVNLKAGRLGFWLRAQVKAPGTGGVASPSLGLFVGYAL